MSGARTAASIAEVVTSGLCIGCGLCESVTAGRVRMRMTPFGALRPTPADSFTAEEEAALLAACPGVVAEARPRPGVAADPIWGAHGEMRYGWAADPELRFTASSGGVLSALGVHLLRTGRVGAVLHVGQAPGRGLENRWTLSQTAGEVLANKGSRYSPTSPLAGLGAALDRGEPFALIAKPCDLGAVHAYARTDARVEELCTHRLAMVCGGQSRITKTLGLLGSFGVDPEDAAVVRYRGHGNPGPTLVETRAGESFEVSYMSQWEDEGSWDLDSRCTLCPDALGEASDVAVADVFPDGVAERVDEGLSAVIPYSDIGDELLASAVEAGDLVLADPLDPRELDAMQAHQVRKKHALAARYQALAAEGRPVIETSGLRIDELGGFLDAASRARQIEGTARRIAEGRYSEPLPE